METIKELSKWYVKVIAENAKALFALLTIYFLTYMAGSFGLLKNTHDLCSIVLDMQSIGWFGFFIFIILLPISFLAQKIFFENKIYVNDFVKNPSIEFEEQKKLLENLDCEINNNNTNRFWRHDNEPAIYTKRDFEIRKLINMEKSLKSNRIFSSVKKFVFISILTVSIFIPLNKIYDYGTINNTTACMNKYGGSFENLVEEDNGILSLILYRQIAPGGDKIDSVMEKADEQLYEKFKNYSYLRGEYKNAVLQNYADYYFRKGMVFEVDEEFSDFVQLSIMKNNESQKIKQEELNYFDKKQGDLFRRNLRKANKQIKKIEEEKLAFEKYLEEEKLAKEKFKSLEGDRVKLRF
ncbi:MAG: hypothetical protein K2W92_02735 [Alphaproteobacteria bacterium]|nr:hypothetical protein [Alphaproteobacteria bacterium]